MKHTVFNILIGWIQYKVFLKFQFSVLTQNKGWMVCLFLFFVVVVFCWYFTPKSQHSPSVGVYSYSVWRVQPVLDHDPIAWLAGQYRGHHDPVVEGVGEVEVPGQPIHSEAVHLWGGSSEQCGRVQGPVQDHTLVVNMAGKETVQNNCILKLG